MDFQLHVLPSSNPTENLNHQKLMKLLLYGQLLQRRLPGRVRQEMFQWMMIL
jgi:hypothetical protein